MEKNSVNTLEPNCLLHNCFMDVQKGNYEAGRLSKEQYDKIRKSPVITETVGRRTYFRSA